MAFTADQRHCLSDSALRQHALTHVRHGRRRLRIRFVR
jgi:hypothetical protein